MCVRVCECVCARARVSLWVCECVCVFGWMGVIACVCTCGSQSDFCKDKLPKSHKTESCCDGVSACVRMRVGVYVCAILRVHKTSTHAHTHAQPQCVCVRLSCCDRVYVLNNNETHILVHTLD